MRPGGDLLVVSGLAQRRVGQKVDGARGRGLLGEKSGYRQIGMKIIRYLGHRGIHFERLGPVKVVSLLHAGPNAAEE